jgi:hypothetical protein
VNRDTRRRRAAFLALLVPAFAVANVNERDLAHCASIDAADQRLACYDTLAGRAPPVAAARAVAVPAAPAAPAASAAAAPAAPATARAPAPPAAATAPVADASTFGFSKAQLHVVDAGPQSIEARVTRVTQNHLGGVNVELDNGQTWTYKDESALPAAGEVVTIKRGALGSYLMITKTKLAMHVQRVS